MCMGCRDCAHGGGIGEGIVGCMQQWLELAQCMLGSGSSMPGSMLSVSTLPVGRNASTSIASAAGKSSGTSGGRRHLHAVRGGEHQGLAVEAALVRQQQ